MTGFSLNKKLIYAIQIVLFIYSVPKKYLVSHWLCKFSYLEWWERSVIFIIATLQLWDTKWEKKIQEITL